MRTHGLGYVLVTPARDEQATLPATIESVTTQSVLPTEWVIVDDGSTDATPRIAADAAAQHGWITVVTRDDEGRRMGSGSTFGDGVAHLTDDSWQLLGKLDADLRFGPDYFERLLRYMEDDPRLGIAGGAIHEGPEDDLQFVPHPMFHVRGAVKLYRRACWDEVATVATGVAYDTLDEVRANQLGWTTRTFRDLVVHHLRPTGGAVGRWPNATKNGRLAWVSGYHPIWQTVRAARVAITTRSITGGVGLWWGYVRAALTREPRCDRDLRRYVQQQQLRRLMGRPSIWR